MSKHRDQIVDAAAGMVEGEILGAAFAKPRGATTAATGGGVIASEVGQRWAGRQHGGAGAAGIAIGNPGALAVTATDLVTMEVAVSLTGQIKAVKEILSVVPLTDVDSLHVKRFGMAGVMEIVAGNAEFKLEGKVADLREFAEAFERAKASA
jgi:hypothetical protein